MGNGKGGKVYDLVIVELWIYKILLGYRDQTRTYSVQFRKQNFKKCTKTCESEKKQKKSRSKYCRSWKGYALQFESPVRTAFILLG